MRNPKLQARIAGALYLVVVGASVFALIANTGIVVRGDDAATVANFAARESVIRLAFAANLIAAVSYTAVVAMLYALLAPVNRTLSIVAAFIGLAGCASSAAFMINQLSALALLDHEGAQTMVRHAMRMGALGNSIALIFFGFYCLCLGALTLGARFMPRWLGIPLLLAGVGWLTGNLTFFIAPEIGAPLSRTLLPISGVGEVLFTLWLAIMGVDTEKWRVQALNSPAPSPQA
ncbi:MAG: DUF4386 domain-containing protein [Hyphomonadaceae bacterium]